MTAHLSFPEKHDLDSEPQPTDGYICISELKSWREGGGEEERGGRERERELSLLSS